jgi:hypothetical protein
MSNNQPGVFEMPELNWGTMSHHLPLRHCAVCHQNRNWVGNLTRVTVLPHSMIGSFTLCEGNNIEVCARCAELVSKLTLNQKLLAAVMLTRRLDDAWLPPFSCAHRNPHLEGLIPRDGTRCIPCGRDTADADVEGHAGHIVSKNDAKRWGLPKWLYNSADNQVVMCANCNYAIGTETPSLLVGLHFLLKPWVAQTAAVGV